MTGIILGKLYRVKPPTESQIRTIGFNSNTYPLGKVVRVTYNYVGDNWHEIIEVKTHKEWGIHGYHLEEYCIWMES